VLKRNDLLQQYLYRSWLSSPFRELQHTPPYPTIGAITALFAFLATFKTNFKFFRIAQTARFYGEA
jgi:hypothetical protein